MKGGEGEAAGAQSELVLSLEAMSCSCCSHCISMAIRYIEMQWSEAQQIQGSVVVQTLICNSVVLTLFVPFLRLNGQWTSLFKPTASSKNQLQEGLGSI